MRDLEFRQATAETLPRHRRATIAIAVAVHAVLLTTLIFVRARPVRVSSAGSTQVSIGPYIPGPVGTAGTSSPSAPVQPKKTTTTPVAKATPTQKEEESGSGQSAEAAATPGGGGQGGSGPVRLGSGGNLTLLTKITPCIRA